MILNDMRIGAGGGSGRPRVRHGATLSELLKNGSNQLRFQAFYISDNGPVALRAIRGHLVSEAKPKLMEWRDTASEAPRLYHGVLFCSIDSIRKRPSGQKRQIQVGATFLQRSSHDGLQTEGLGGGRPSRSAGLLRR